ncbi:MAG: isopentenyl phosphate kinase [Anaerolineales bacterium]|jgi:isopentenyl phosphate kinase
MRELVFLKLGGSLITDKTQAYTPRLDKLGDLSDQIARALRNQPELLLVLGHGSGSFGHTAAQEYRTRDGAPAPAPLAPAGHSPRFQKKRGEIEGGEYWKGFTEVWYQASRLNRFVIQALHEAGIPAMTFSPAASVWSENGKVVRWDLSQIEYALEVGIVPVVHGDVIFDKAKGGTILSTEELFEHLARELHPGRILLAGLEEGIWADFPARRQKVERVTRKSFNEIEQSTGKATGADVTGGMESKVRQMLELAEAIPGLTIQIFSGEWPENLQQALAGKILGTIIAA